MSIKVLTQRIFGTVEERRDGRAVYAGVDPWLAGLAMFLLATGLLMVTTSSLAFAEKNYNDPFYFVWKQAIYIAVGLGLGWAVTRIRMDYWARLTPLLIGMGFLLLIMVLIPGLGIEVNGSRRWLGLVVFRLQPSELMKLILIMYVAGYVARHGRAATQTLKGFLVPVSVAGVACILFLQQPDFGASVVVMATVMVMLFLAGCRLRHFIPPGVLVLVSFLFLAMGESYRLQRLTSFMEPWADPYDTGFQLTQALIAFGRGEWLGVGLGNSVQKLHYLPESHTDFVLAILGEEFGLLGMLALLLVYTLLLWRMFAVADAARARGRVFAALTVYGIAIWMAGQMLINVGVNMGVLPTKGLTLPLMSYGGSSIVVMCVATALVIRTDMENRFSGMQARRRGGGK